MERFLLRWIPRDESTWRVVGSPDAMLSVSSERDIGKFATETALLAWTQPDLVPDHVRVVVLRPHHPRLRPPVRKTAGPKSALRLRRYRDGPGRVGEASTSPYRPG